ncbi:MAG: glycoside hydrolase [Clostridiales bacterium]|jgi:predicted neuraminidase|nr:glycoside hydrolase [Clostridiales bacterium]
MLITNTERLKQFYSTKRIWQGLPAIERTKNGRLFAAFYSGGIKEEFGNYAVLLKSDDDGESWSEPIAVAYEGEEARAYDQCLWIDQLGRLWFIWNTMPINAVWASICNDLDADSLVWSEPFVIGNDVMINKPTALSNGEWLFPVSAWALNLLKHVPNLATPHAERKPYVYKTADTGKTFTCLGGAKVAYRSYDEHQILELKDGRLLMAIRTSVGIDKSYSEDGGLTWSDSYHWLGNPNSRIFLQRLSSGNILLVNHYKFAGRNNLTAMISDDEGETFKGNLILDGRDNVSYPDGKEGENGFVYIVYDHERGCFCESYEKAREQAREILMAKITEEDILAGKSVSKESKLRVTISRLGDYDGDELWRYRVKYKGCMGI